MIATSHLIIGGSVGVATAAYTNNPGLALLAGFVSHLLCDLLPHWDHPDAPRIGRELVWTRAVWVFAYADSITGGLLTLAIWGLQFDYDLLSPFLWGAAGGYLPDFIDNVPFWKNQIRAISPFKQFHRLHEWVHEVWQTRYPMPQYWILGTATQVALVIPALWLIFR